MKNQIFNNSMLQKMSYFLVLIMLISYVHSQLNTHQTIIMRKPLYFKINLKENDHVEATVFDMNGEVKIFYRAKGRLFSSSLIEYCFVGKPVLFEFESKLNETAIIGIEVRAYQYSYEIRVNGLIIGREEDVVQDFLDYKYFISKPLAPATYKLKAYYESQSIPKLFMILAMKNYTIIANQLNEIDVEIEAHDDYEVVLNVLSILFDNPLKLQLEDRLVSVSIQMPNSMLRGCYGTNTYDSRIRACPPSAQMSPDYLVLHNIGTYPSFTIAQTQKVIIKITILQFQIIKQLLLNQSLTLYYSKQSYQKNFRNLTRSQLIQKYPSKPQCIIKSTVCKFMLELPPGNYTLMPIIEKMSDFGLVYLFQRYNSKAQMVQQFYSFFPIVDKNQDTFQQFTFAAQFVSYQSLAQITLQSESDFLIQDYQIFSRVKGFNYNQGEYNLEIKQRSYVTIFDKNSRKAIVYVQLSPNRIYIMAFTIFSKQKFLNDQNPKMKLGYDNNSQVDQQNIIKIKELKKGKTNKILKNYPTNQDYLDVSAFQISIKNGKFPHRKIQQAFFVSNISENSFFSGSFWVENSLALVLAILGIFVFILLLILGFKLKTTIIERWLRGGKFVEEQSTSNVNVRTTEVTSESSTQLPQRIRKHEQKMTEVNYEQIHQDQK